MTVQHWDRYYAISEQSVISIKRELNTLRRCMITCPDSETAAKNILETLAKLEVVP